MIGGNYTTILIIFQILLTDKNIIYTIKMLMAKTEK